MDRRMKRWGLALAGSVSRAMMSEEASSSFVTT